MPSRVRVSHAALFCLCWSTGFLVAQNTSDWPRGRIIAAPNGHHLQHEDGTPFFWLGDTAWELFHRLDRAEIIRYLDDRAAKGFTVIQAVALAEMDGLRLPNRDGEVPLIELDPTRPNEKYFALVDDVVALARQRGLVLGLLPTWGDKVTKLWGEGPVVFDENNARVYGRWLGERYRDAPNLIWILGGDRPPRNAEHDWTPVWRAMAQGINEGTGERALITYHISGGSHTTSEFLHQEPWLDVNMMQSGHGGGHDQPVWDWIARDHALTPSRPTLDSEPNYEDHPVNPWPTWDPRNGFFRDHDVRKQCYRSVFAGACGVTYGHHAIWQFYSSRVEKINHADRTWTEALDRPGAFQVGYLRRLMESRPFVQTVPGQTLLGEDAGEGSNHAQALRATDGSFAMIYLPVGRAIVISGTFASSPQLRAWWFSPRDGRANEPNLVKREAEMHFTPPTTGGENDWVLVLDDPRAGFGPPGE